MVDVIGALATIASVILNAPQAMKVWRFRSEPEALEGVSAGTQLLILLNASLWFVYAWLTEAWWVGAPGFLNIPLSIAVLYFLFRNQK